MQWLLEQILWLKDMAHPDQLRELAKFGGHAWIGYAILTAIIFSETGLLIGFFLPGDSLLFATGFLASQGVFNIWLLVGLLCAAAIIGDAVNYMLGRQMTEHVFEHGHMRFVKHKHLLAAKAFYDKHGGKAIVLARFVPIVRTFTPFVAGIAKMSYRQFVVYNVVGGIGWVVSMSLAGYWLGQIPWVEKNFEKVTLGIIAISVLPIVIEVVKHWLTAKKPVVADQPD